MTGWKPIPLIDHLMLNVDVAVEIERYGTVVLVVTRKPLEVFDDGRQVAWIKVDTVGRIVETGRIQFDQELIENS